MIKDQVGGKKTVAHVNGTCHVSLAFAPCKRHTSHVNGASCMQKAYVVFEWLVEHAKKACVVCEWLVEDAKGTCRV